KRLSVGLPVVIKSNNAVLSFTQSPRRKVPRSFPNREEATMHFGDFGFGSLCINETTYEHDLIIDGGKIRKRKKKPSKRFHEEFGHTPLSIEEEIPWKYQRLVIGTGAYGRLPVMEVKREAERRKVELLIAQTSKPI